MDERAKIPPGLPRPNPTVSYWQHPPDSIADLRSTQDLPKEADYVIVGSGVSGACVAYNLLSRKPNAVIVILEARSACSGATGRNGESLKNTVADRPYKTNTPAQAVTPSLPATARSS